MQHIFNYFYYFSIYLYALYVHLSYVVYKKNTSFERSLLYSVSKLYIVSEQAQGIDYEIQAN